jgi:ATP-dependent DNA helicase UvrD/PcrA
LRIITDYLERLNENQKQAVEYCGGPLMIIAGPGTGKTRILVAKILYLISEKKVDPKRILAVTFTKKAAKEMEDRLRGNPKQNSLNLPAVSQSDTPASFHKGGYPMITTFHSLGYEILNEGKKEKITILDDEERREILRNIKKELRLTGKTVKQLGLEISREKQNIVKFEEDIPRPLACPSQEGKLLQAYEEVLKDRELVDYDDLLIQSYGILEKRSKSLGYFDYVLVDEFQDTNKIQYEMAKKVLTGKNLTVIGDPKQSIYSFRGSNNQAFEDFKKDFKNFKQINLNINYRCQPKIGKLAASLFNDDGVVCVNKKAGEVSWIETFNEYTEAEFVLKKIDELVGGTNMISASKVHNRNEENVNFADIGVIYRLHSVGRVLQKTFEESGIPYQIIGKQSPFESKEVKMVIEVLRWLGNKSEKNIPLAFSQPLSKGEFIERFGTLDKTEILSELVSEIVEMLELENEITSPNPSLQRRGNNLNYFRAQILRFDKYKNGLVKFLDYLNYLKEYEYYDGLADKVTLLTMHAAKGLEFSHVFICGAEEGMIPFAKNENIEEERRLFYVAITRAKNGLYIINCRNRSRKEQRVSRFKNDLDESCYSFVIDEVIERMRKKKLKKSQMKMF